MSFMHSRITADAQGEQTRIAYATSRPALNWTLNCDTSPFKVPIFAEKGNRKTKSHHKVV